MGQYIVVQAAMSTPTKCIVMDLGNTDVSNSIIGGGVRYSKALQTVFLEVSKLYPQEEFTCFTASSHDFESTWKWAATVSNGTATKVRSEELDDELETPLMRTVPDNGANIYLNEDGITNDLVVIGFPQLEIAKVVYRVFSKECTGFSVRVGKEVIVDGVVKPITDLSASQLKKLGLQASFENITGTLFTFSVDKDRVTAMHDELMAFYASPYDAIEGYQRGEFALWKTAEGPKFYCTWRSKVEFAVFCRLGHKPIEGELQSTNLLMEKAVAIFEQDAVRYTRGSSSLILRPDNPLDKIVSKDGQLVAVKFSLSDYYPL